MDKKRFVYEEDMQGYWHNHVLMEQCGDGNIKKLEAIYRDFPGAGRISESVGMFMEIAKKHGLNLCIIERREKSQNVPKEWENLPLIKGSQGNY